jgi:predicted NBD/HSP70 family sugar kinase
LRERNLRLVARAVFEAQEPCSRADVASATSLARATVSTLVDRLIAGGLVTEIAPVATQRAGRPAVPLVPAPRTIVGLGLEVNVDYLRAAVVDLTETVIAERVIQGDFGNSDPNVVLPRMGAVARELIDECAGMRFAGARLALPALIDSARGIVRVAPNLGWRDMAPAELLGLGRLPIVAGNDAKLAALAELEDPAAKDFVFLTADVGVGGAVVVERRLFLGERGWNGEIGHVLVDPGGPRCGCGSSGCRGQYAGKEALMRAARLPIEADITVLVEALEAGDPTALAAVSRAAGALGSALADFVNLVGVPTVILGGIFAELMPWIAADISTALAERVLAAPYTSVEVRCACAGQNAAVIGGAREVLRDVLAFPADWV